MHDEDDEIERNLAELLGPLQRAAEQLAELLREAAETDPNTDNSPESEGR